jgi:signal transduction histidine kinase
MRIRLFWQLIVAFVILIIFGIGGTMSLIGVTFGQIYSQNLPSALQSIENSWTVSLADYYVAHDNSWAGVGSRLDTMLQWEDWFPGASVGYVLTDRDGAVIVQHGDHTLAWLNERGTTRPGHPIVVDNVEVGRLALIAPSRNFMGPGDAWRDEIHVDNGRVQPGGRRLVESGGGPRIERDVERQIGRAFLGVALALGSVMLGLAVIVSRRISAPLSRVNAAARRVAGGDLHAQVPGSSISELDALASSFNQMTADLRNADELRRNMTADIAHELRTPLTIIKGKLEGIMDGVYTADPEHIGLVLEEATLLERLIDDLRVLSLVEAGQLPLYTEDIAVADMLADARAAFAREAATHGIMLEIGEVPPDTRITVDAQRMQQVLGNLLSNSLRYTPTGGRVTLSAARHSESVSIVITDTGLGIAPQDLRSIFERFYRSDKARSHHGQGAGLGLAIAKQLVEAQGGRVSATSTLGEGTTITLQIPVVDQRPTTNDSRTQKGRGGILR